MAIFLRTKFFNRQKFMALSLAATLMASGVSLMPLPGFASPAGKDKSAATEYQRLPQLAVPERYDLYFEPDFDKNEFEGTETVYLQVSETTKEITLNSVELSVFDASISRSEKTHGDWIKADIQKNPARETVVFKFPKDLTPGRYELAVKFNGKLNEKMEGFYLSRFKDKDGKEMKMCSTHMEPSDARRMFPCFDEPIYKATYRVTAAIPPDMVALSNAAVQFEKSDNRKGKKIVTFEESPKMSSYLFALVIGNLKATEPMEVNGKQIRVWCTEDKLHLTSFALNSAVKFMTYYEDYFGVPYPLKKLDLIGIPDFAHGAMENIGAITFRETALLVDEQNGATHAKMRVADVVAHEMAHLWFGDLVTMAWWNDLWLNEAFATWMADKAVNHIKPEWRIWDDFAVDRAGNLSDDSINSTRAVQCTVNSPNDALEMFDEITYGKGADLLRMLEMYLSEDTFRSGIRSYMKKHSFANATTDDLWQALSQAARKEDGGKGTKGGTDVSALMQSWVHAPGCPIVSFKKVSEKKKGKAGETVSTVLFEQERSMLLESGAKKPAASSREKPTVWAIPMVIKGGSDVDRKVFNGESEKLAFDNFEPLFLNGLGNGFFRTRYDSTQLAALGDKIKSNKEYLTPAERISLISDLWDMTFTGRLSIDEYLAFTNHFCGDEDPYVQSMLVGQLCGLEGLIADDMRPGFQALVRNRLTPVLDRLTMSKREGDSDLINSLRGNLICTLGTIGNDKKIVEWCRGQFETYLNDEKSLEGNLLAPIVDVVAYNGGDEEFGRIQTAYVESKEPEARQRNLQALSFFREKDQVERALAYSLSKEVRAQDVTKFVVGPLLSNTASKHLAWQFVKDHWSDFGGRLTDDQMPKMIDSVASFSTEKEREDVQAFVAAHPLPAGRRRVAKTLEMIAIRSQFRDKQSTSLAAFLKKLVVANSAG